MIIRKEHFLTRVEARKFKSEIESDTIKITSPVRVDKRCWEVEITYLNDDELLTPKAEDKTIAKLKVNSDELGKGYYKLEERINSLEAGVANLVNQLNTILPGMDNALHTLHTRLVALEPVAEAVEEAE